MLFIYSSNDGFSKEFNSYYLIKDVCKKILLKEFNHKYYDKISLRHKNDDIILNIDINDYDKAYHLLMENTVYNIYLTDKNETLHIYTNSKKKECVKYIENYVKNINNQRNINIYLMSDNYDNESINDYILWYHINDDGKIIEIINHNKDFYEKIYENHKKDAKYRIKYAAICIIFLSLIIIFYIIHIFIHFLLVHYL